MTPRILALVALSRGTGIVFNLVFTLYLAKYLGAKETGIIFFSITLITVASLITRFGYDHTLMKRISPLWEKKEYTKIINHIHQALIVIGIISTIVCISLLFLLKLLNDNLAINQELYISSVASLKYIFPLGSMWALSASLKAHKSPNIAGFIESGSIPFLTLTQIFTFNLFGIQSNSLDIINYYGISIISACLVSYFILILKNKIRVNTKNLINLGDFSRISFLPSVNIVLMSVSNYALVWLPVFYLTILKSEELSGIYSTMLRISMLVSFVLIVFNGILAPKFAILFNQDQLDQVQELARAGVKKMLTIALPIGITIIILAKTILNLLGDDYINSQLSFQLLILAQIVNVYFGPVIYLLTMSGNEKAITKVTVFLFFISTFTSFLLIYFFNLLGACISTIINITLLNYLANTRLKKITKISSSL